MHWHQQTTCISLQTDYHTDSSSLYFYRQDALPDARVKALEKNLKTFKKNNTGPVR